MTPHSIQLSDGPKSPSLFWRRFAAVLIDLLVLDIFERIALGIIGTNLWALILAWAAFLLVWYTSSHLTGASPGKLLAGTITRYKVDEFSGPALILLRFIVVWAPLLAIKLLYTTPSESHPFLWLCLLWYLLVAVGMAITRGKGGLQDQICDSQTMASPLTAHSKTRKLVICGALLLCVLLRLHWAYLADVQWQKDHRGGDSAVTGNETLPPETPGIPFESLKLSAPFVRGYFIEEDSLSPNDTVRWTGSAVVIGKIKDKLYLVTNRHVLGLEELAASDDDGTPETSNYDLRIIFASGKYATVEHFTLRRDDFDLTWLVIDGTGLVEGRDYQTLEYTGSIPIRLGDDVVAVGSPNELHGTHTFGKISAIRESGAVIQTDAAINPGNSGGPLLVKSGDRYHWIGVNTWKVGGNDNLGFAISAALVITDDQVRVEANARGATQAVEELYR
ncbi:hypothetical protein NT6N_03090 [Oceaniferula spumae]|uniref:RDD domain-containing protein n=1 Tax=Oceaniferula spumae TaxID=2979115 RepID=A0AAT9FH83_9BACT